MLRNLLLLIIGCFIVACSAETVDTGIKNEGSVETFVISSQQVDCVGVEPRKCLLVRRSTGGSAQTPYGFFYDGIEGFTWEMGHTYEITVRVSQVADPPADGSSVRYELIEIVRQTEVGNVVDWETAVFLINSGAVTEIGQTHSLDVDLFFADGQRLETVEPAIDDVFDVVRKCGEPCAHIAMMTE